MTDPGADAPGSLTRTVLEPRLGSNIQLGLAALAVLYLGAAELSLTLAIAPGFASAVWPPSGIALAALLLYGVRLWPAVWVAALLANVDIGSPWLPAAAIATGHTLEALTACALVHRFMGRDAQFDGPEAAFRFAAIVATAALVAASVGTAALSAAGLLSAQHRLANWYTWWQGDLTGMMVLAPFLLAWLRVAPRDGARPGARNTEIIAFAAALAATFAIAFALAEAQPDLARMLTFLLIAFVAWAGCRFGERIVTATVLMLAAVMVWATVDQRSLSLFDSVEDALLVLQTFIATMAVMGLALAALTRQRGEAELRLRQASDRLEAAVSARTEELAQKNRELAADLAERERLASALEQREAQLAEAQALTHIGSWNWDVGADRLTWSKELLRIFGIRAEDAGGTLALYLARIHPQDRARVQATIRGALTTRAPWESTERIVRSDASVRLLKTVGGVWVDAAGEVSALYGASLDVTEATRRELMQTVQHAITGILVRAPSWPDAMVEAMRTFCQTLDWALGQMWLVDEARSLIRFNCVWPRDAHPEFVAASKALVFGKGQGLPGRTWLRAAPEWIEDAPEDPARPRARWARQCGLHGALCFPLTAGGRVLGVLEFYTTERRRPQDELLQAVVALGSQLGEYIVRNRAEMLLRESEERFRLLIEGVKDYAIVMLDPQGRVATWNSGAARINGYLAEEILGHHFSRFHTAEDRQQKTPELLLAEARERGAVEAEGWRVRKDGSRFWGHVVITVLYGADGTLRGFAKVTRDLTERKQVEALEEAGRQTRQFLAMLGHELRNPLAPIRNAVGVMRMREIADPQIKYCRDLIERQVTHLARLVDDLLDASRITTGMIGLQPERLDLARVVGLAVEASRPGIEQRSHKLTVDLSPEPMEVSGDQTRLVQVVQNLLNNAAKYTPGSGHITLAVSREDGMARIAVSDDGIGIAPELLPRIFDLFMQGDGGLARTEGGLGVGLTLARRIAEMHGGSIQAQSGGIGHGATFIVRLPLLDPAPVPVPEHPSAPGGAARTRARNVLVVDDNRDAADSVAALLGLRGHRVHIAYEGPGALALAAEHAPEVVLLDIGLPGMDGYEIAQRLRALAQTRHARIVALTGYGQDEDRRRSAEASFDAHLVKPVDYATLYALIEGDTVTVSGLAPGSRG
jgi:PAS domain S-box-containing protein